MKSINAYLNFDGNCREAMKFYEKCLGGKLEMMPFSEGKMDVPKEMKDKVMHARLEIGDCQLMASDSMPGKGSTKGSNFAISIQCESSQEIDKMFAAISTGGKITMPLQDTFWNARFGMLTDQFGINWMLNFDKGAGHN